MSTIDTLRPIRDTLKDVSRKAEKKFHDSHATLRRESSCEHCHSPECPYCRALSQGLDEVNAADSRVADVETLILDSPGETIADIALKLEIMCDMAPGKIDPDVGGEWFPALRPVAREITRLAGAA